MSHLVWDSQSTQPLMSTIGYLEHDPCGLILIADGSMDSRSTQPLARTT
jgi:hypothetical protein